VVGALDGSFFACKVVPPSWAAAGFFGDSSFFKKVLIVSFAAFICPNDGI
jgi:hypothetical protein